MPATIYERATYFEFLKIIGHATLSDWVLLERADAPCDPTLLSRPETWN